jgi:hypothetical protein
MISMLSVLSLFIVICSWRWMLRESSMALLSSNFLLFLWLWDIYIPSVVQLNLPIESIYTPALFVSGVQLNLCKIIFTPKFCQDKNQMSWTQLYPSTGLCQNKNQMSWTKLDLSTRLCRAWDPRNQPSEQAATGERRPIPSPCLAAVS